MASTSYSKAKAFFSLLSISFCVASIFAGTPELITVAPNGSGLTASGFSAGGQMSGDGRFVLFQSTAANLTLPPTDGVAVNLFLADRQQNTVTVVTKNLLGTGGANASCVNATMSDDAKFVVFETTATNLTERDIDSATDIYLRDVAAGTTVRISNPKPNLNSIRRADSTNATISADGGRIAYKSGTTDLVTAPLGTKIPLFFLYDRIAGTNRAIWSIDLFADQTTTTTSDPFISKSGGIVFFHATGRELLTRATTTGQQLYAYDLATDTLRNLTTNVMSLLGKPATTVADHVLRAASSNGNVAVFLSNVAFQSGPSRTNVLFRHLVAENATEIIATNVNWKTDGVAPFPEVALSPDGRFVTYASKGNIYRYDAEGQVNELVTVGLNGQPAKDLDVSAPMMSADGRYIAFVSSSTNLVAGPKATLPQLYRRDMLTETIERVSAEPGGIAATSAAIYDGSMTDDGQTIVFTSNDPDFISGDLNGGPDCLIWEAAKTPRISAISKAAVTVTAQVPFLFLSVSTQPISRDGKVIAFSGQLDGVPEIWVRDRIQNTTKLVSYTADTISPGAGPSYNAMVSSDGLWIAYETSSSNLVSNIADANNAPDVVLYDSRSGTNRFLTKNATNNASVVGGGELRAMSPNGRYLAIASSASGTGAGALIDPPATINAGSGATIFLWDRDTSLFRLLTTNSTGVGVRGAHTNFVFSPDSKRLAFFAFGTVAYLDAVTGESAQATAGSVTLLIHEVETGVTKGFAVATTNRTAAFSADGTKLITTALGNSTNRGIWRIDLVSGAQESVLFNAGQVSAFGTPDAKGEVAFSLESIATPFVGVLDIATGATSQVATIQGRYPSHPQISLYGSLLIYQSYVNSASIGDTNGYPNPIFVDRNAQNITPIANGNGPSVGPILSGDGSTLLVLTQATDLITGDLNNAMDLVAYSLPVTPRVTVMINSQNGVELRFPLAVSDYVLESAPALDGTVGAWQPVTTDISADGDSVVAKISLSDSMRFFRLHK